MTFHLPIAAASRDLHRDDSDDEEETLSLCEFSINSSSDSQNSSFKSSSTQEEDEDSACFEFFSEEWNTTTLTHDDHHNQKSSSSFKNNNAIIFCGKLIPSKEPAVSKKIQKSTSSSKQNLAPLLTSPAPSKWYLFFFGITKFRTKMELKDIKMRQSRSRRSSSSIHSSYSADNETIVNSTCMAKNKGGGVLAAMLRTLSCGSSGDHRAADVMVRPFSTGGTISKPSGVKSISRLLCMA